MSRACTVCTSEYRAEIDKALVADTPYRRIAAQHAVSEQAVRRHRAEHLPEKLAQAEGATAAAEATDLLHELRVLRSKAYSLLLRAEREGDLKTALMGIREARACLELLAELEGELDRRPVVNLLVAPEWIQVRGALLEALTTLPRGENRRGGAPASAGGGRMMLAADLAMALDPVELARAAGLDPDPWQVQALRSAAPRLAFNVARQLGKSTVAATLATHQAVYSAGSLTLLLSPGLRQSGELFRKVVNVYHATGSPVAPETENTLELELNNGSRVVSLPGTEKTVRGFSAVDLLIVDEASRVDDALYAAIRPMLAVSNGRLITMSTPFGARGWWWKEWVDGGPAWERYEVNAEQCPRISPEFLAGERQWGDLFYQSEYECRFVDTEDAVFNSDDVMRALVPSLPPLLEVTWP